jgi:hypothetical protein
MTALNQQLSDSLSSIPDGAIMDVGKLVLLGVLGVGLAELVVLVWVVGFGQRRKLSSVKDQAS